MRVIVQRVKEAKVEIDRLVVGQIQKGLLLLLGIEEADGQEDIDWLCQKIVKMRIFGDEQGNMNCSLKEVDGEILVVSHFTLHASVKKGNHPSFIKAAKPQQAEPLYEQFKKEISKQLGKKVQSGEFGANMQVSLLNDGPVTIFMDSKNKN